MKKCIVQAVKDAKSDFLKSKFMSAPINMSGYELEFRNIVMSNLSKLIKSGKCNSISKSSEIKKEVNFKEITFNGKRTDISINDNGTNYIIEFGHYTTGQPVREAINKPVSDIYKWLKYGFTNIYTVNVITHWNNISEPKGYKWIRTQKTKKINIKEITDYYKMIDSNVKIPIDYSLKPNFPEMHVFVKGPFKNAKDWNKIKSKLSLHFLGRKKGNIDRLNNII